MAINFPDPEITNPYTDQYDSTWKHSDEMWALLGSSQACVPIVVSYSPDFVVEGTTETITISGYNFLPNIAIVSDNPNVTVSNIYVNTKNDILVDITTSTGESNPATLSFSTFEGDVYSTIVINTSLIVSMNAIVWFDAMDETTLFVDAGITNVSAQDDLIYQWNDKSGNGRNLTQTVSADRPLYKTNLVEPVVYFDGISKHLNNLVAFSGETYTEITAFIVMYPFAAQPDSNARVLNLNKTGQEDHNTTTGVIMCHFSDADSRNQAGIWQDSGQLNTQTGEDDTTEYLIYHSEIDFSNGVGNIYKGNVFKNTDTFTANSGIDPDELHVSSRFNNAQEMLLGNMCEIIMFDKILTTQERLDVYTNLNTKWAGLLP